VHDPLAVDGASYSSQSSVATISMVQRSVSMRAVGCGCSPNGFCIAACQIGVNSRANSYAK
jgi:hypothetical protein